MLFSYSASNNIGELITTNRNNYFDYNSLKIVKEKVGEIEKHHEERYMKLVGNIEENLVFEKGEEVIWICRNCGYIYKGTTALKVCPVCKHPESYMEVK